MNIGIDFGTTYTKIAYLDQDGKLALFEYPKGEEARKFIPTAVSYPKASGGTLKIGETARLEMGGKKYRFCENFKMLLPLAPEEWEKHGWPPGSPPPADVTRDYLRQLLFAEKKSFAAVHQPITNVVVSVPEVWQREVDNRGADALQRIAQTDLGLPLDRLMSEPVCAAAYYAYQHHEQRGAFVGNAIVCDMGGGTFDVALCRVNGLKVDVLCFDGNGRRELGLAGVTFDQLAVKTAWQRAFERSPDVGSRAFLRAVEEFEKQKIAKGIDPELLQTIREFPEAADTPIEWDIQLESEEYEFTYQHILDAFQPIRAGMQEVIERVKTKAAQRGWKIDRRIIVGGFGQFFLVQQALEELLPLDYPDDAAREFDRTIGSHPGIVAFGAALIANKKIDPVEYYPHTIGVCLFTAKTNADVSTLEKKTIPIILADQIPANQPQKIYFMMQPGTDKRLPVSVKVRDGKLLPLPVRIKRGGEGDWIDLKTEEHEYPAPGRYYIGVTLDRSNLVTLLFEPVAGENPHNRRKYDLGQLSFDLIVEE